MCNGQDIEMKEDVEYVSVILDRAKGIAIYRGIALSSLFSKIFDHCIISCEDAALKLDDLQFAYKSGMSTIQCASVITETINYYLHNKSDIYIYMCTIDAS